MADITDPRIQEIMAQLAVAEQNEDQQSKVSTDPEKTRPPLTYEEFCIEERIDEWPQRITSESLMDLGDERELLGDKDKILEELKGATSLDLGMLDDLEQRLGILQEKLSFYAERTIEEKPQNQFSDSPMFHALPRAFLTDMGETDMQQVHAKKKKSVEEAMQETKKRCVEYCSFPGYRRGELTELPGQLEAPQILHRVTKAMDFNPGFKKFWKKIFQSEASVAVMQDTFWWFFLHKYEANRVEDRSKLFDRIADSFVALFNSVNPEIKDKVFSEYPDCLAQAVFTAFWEAFPESDRHFQDEFKQQLSNIIYDWIAGIHPPPGVWKKWNLKRLESKSQRTSEDNNVKAAKSIVSATSLSKPAVQSIGIDDFHKTVARLGETSTLPGADPAQQTVTTEPTSLSLTRQPTNVSSLNVKSKGAATETSTMELVPSSACMPLPASRQAHCGSPHKPAEESHQIGPGAQLQRVMFNLEGQSPLVSHYLQMRQLRQVPSQHVSKNKGRCVRRTEITRLPPKGPTYKDVIQESMAMSTRLSTEYQKICEHTNSEIRKIERQQREFNQRIEKLKREVLFSKNTGEIKILSERIFDKKEKGNAKPEIDMGVDDECSLSTIEDD